MESPTTTEATQAARRSRRQAELRLEDAERALLAHVHDTTARTIELIAACAAAELEARKARGWK